MADARLAVAIVLDRPRRREACGHDGLIKSSAIGAGGRYWHRSWPAQEHADPISALRQFLQEMSPNETGGAGKREQHSIHCRLYPVRFREQSKCQVRTGRFRLGLFTRLILFSDRFRQQCVVREIQRPFGADGNKSRPFTVVQVDDASAPTGRHWRVYRALDSLGAVRPLIRFAGVLTTAAACRDDKISPSAASQCCSASPSRYPLAIHIS